MINPSDLNTRMIISVAQRLGDLRNKVVFVGGCAAGLLVTDPAMPGIRSTLDVDVIVEVYSRLEYYKLEEQLRRKGFTQDITEGAPVCRWLVDTIKVDFMPTQGDILGFTNLWYLPAIRHAVRVEIQQGTTILLVAAPYFLATKIEAFKGRGREDYMASHDMEDIITVLDGRQEIIAEIRNSPEDLWRFLSESFRMFLAQQSFLDALPGHLPPDRASQARLPRLIKLLEGIAGI